MKILEQPLKKPQQILWNWNNQEPECRHVPVMCAKALDSLQLSPGKVIVDCTVGEGGHSDGILRKITPGGYLIGIDQDDDAISATRGRLSPFNGSFSLFQLNFRHVRQAVAQAGYEQVDGVLFDLGISMRQLGSPERGFSFRLEGPLNMRMDKRGQITAFDLVNNLSQEEIATILYRFGEERHSRRIAARIVEERHKQAISSTTQLADIVERSVPDYERHRKIHPATKTFMALRIAVNRELDVIQQGVRDAISLLRSGGRICVISFHSLEDRIVKHEFRAQAHAGAIQLITKKPLIPDVEEQQSNAASRSAKMRVAVKL